MTEKQKKKDHEQNIESAEYKEKFFASIVQSSEDAIISETLDGKIASWNPAAEKIFGYTSEEVIGKPMNIIGPKEKEGEFDEIIDKMKKGKKVEHFETQRKTKDGAILNVSVTVSPIKDDDGNIIGISAVDRNITKEKRSAGYARSLIEASLDPLVTISPEGKITDVNEASIRATGATREELIGSDFSEYFTEPEKAKSGYEKVLKEGQVSDYPLTIKNKSGRLMDVLYNASVYKDDRGKVIGVFAAARDITAQKQASQYARSLIEASLDPLVTISPEGKITDVNEASIKATGNTREELIGSDFSEYFTEPEKAKTGYEKVLKEGQVSDYALTIKHKNGKLMDVLYNASVYKDDKGKVIGIFAAARDITAQKQASQYARSLIEASLDPLVTISPQGKITDVNEASIRATGATREELIGSDFSEYFTEPSKAKAGYEKVFKEGKVSDYALTIKHRKGKLMDVLYNASVYKDDKGKVLGVFAAARDITAQKQASQYARSLIESSLDPLVTISPEGKVTDVNKATEKATGLTREQLIGTDFTGYFTQPEKAKAGYEEVFEKGEVRDYLLTIHSVTGKLTNVLYNASVYKDEKGKVLGVFAAAREIGRSELKAAQARELMRTSTQRVFKVGISYKLGRGTVKIHDIDCKKIGIGIIDNVTIKPTKKELSGRKLVAMSYSQSKFPQEMIVMSPVDVKTLGLEEEDTVFVSKATGAEEEIELVEDYDYAPGPGEYQPSKEQTKKKKTKKELSEDDGEGTTLNVMAESKNSDVKPVKEEVFDDPVDVKEKVVSKVKETSEDTSEETEEETPDESNVTDTPEETEEETPDESNVTDTPEETKEESTSETEEETPEEPEEETPEESNVTDTPEEPEEETPDEPEEEKIPVEQKGEEENSKKKDDEIEESKEENPMRKKGNRAKHKRTKKGKEKNRISESDKNDFEAKIDAIRKSE